jgi:acetyltransferase-like isoleucine patch superfamily enzyme
MLPQPLQALENKIWQRLERYLQPLIQQQVQQQVQQQIQQILPAELVAARSQWLTVASLQPVVQEIIDTRVRIWGDVDRLKISPQAQLVNSLLNTSSGNIEIGAYTFTGHNVCILTGSHDYKKQLEERLADYPKFGRDITIGQGVWIGSNAMILGPCQIGDHAVVAAGAVVVPGSVIPAGAIVAGIPAKIIKQINLAEIRE